MKKSIENFKITYNFSFYEFVEAKMPSQAIELNWKYINEMSQTEKDNLIDNVKLVAHQLQDIRNYVNKKFAHRNINPTTKKAVPIAITVSCGLRCPKWEIIKKRGLTTQHILAWAADFLFANVFADDLYNEIMEDVYNMLNNSWTGGVASFFATEHKINKLIEQKNTALAEAYKKRPWRFIHIDFKQGGRRWSY
jgi:hypothetical protein